jgi:uncharacterized protein
MFKTRLATLLLTSSLAGSALTACGDRAPHIIQVHPESSPLEPRQGQMTVTGQATLEVSPDCADILVTISVENGKTAAAVKTLEHKKLALVAALQALGVETAQVKLSNLGLDPVYAVDGRGSATQLVRGYRASITVTATTKDFGKIGDIVEAAASSGSTSISTSFRRSDLAELKKKVRDMALKAAREKAEQTASTLGIKLGRIVSVGENAGGYMWTNQYFPSNSMAAITTQDAAVVLGGQLQPLTLDVSVGYELASET